LPGGSVRYGVSRDEEEVGSREEEKSRNEEEMEEEEGEADRMQSWAGWGTGVRRFKQHLYAPLLTLTSSRALSCAI